MRQESSEAVASQYREKSAVIDAIRLGRSPLSLHDVLEFIGSTKPYTIDDEEDETHAIIIPLLDGGIIRVNVGDWVIRNADGVHSCTAEYFDKTYERAAIRASLEGKT